MKNSGRAIGHQMAEPTKLIATSPVDAGVLLLQLDRPGQRNALSGDLLCQAAAILVAAETDPAIHCVVITGDTRAFSAGADIKEMERDGFNAISNHARQSAWHEIEHFPKPMIAAVRGLCLGGGLELAMLGDIIIAADNAVFGQPEITIGIIPGDGATQRLTRVIGKSLAMKMVLTGEPVTASELLQRGLIAEMLPAGQVLDRAIALAKLIASRAPIAARLGKEAVLAAYETTLSAGLEVERRAVRLAFRTSDQKEGMTAFVEKRTANFTGN
jgi:enoyl-CoA hydratase